MTKKNLTKGSFISLQLAKAAVVLLVGFYLTSFALANEMAGDVCQCPDRSDPVAVLHCVLDAPADGSRTGISYCMAKPHEGYPSYPPFDFKRPNVYRAYRILSVSDGKPYKGQPTKKIELEFDYVAQLSERHPEGKMLCKLWRQTVTAYQTDRGWIVSHPANMGGGWKLKPLLDAARIRLGKRFAVNDIFGINSISTEILALEKANNQCALPPSGDWK